MCAFILLIMGRIQESVINILLNAALKYEWFDSKDYNCYFLCLLFIYNFY